MSTQRFKIVLLGEGRVGKTSIVLRFVKGEFDDRRESTMQASYLDKTMTVAGQSVHLSIWDTAGQERFHALGPIYYRDADGALLVYDITHEDSFERVQHWVKELRSMVGHDIALAIAANKTDLEKHRVVDDVAAARYAESVGASHFRTSAKLNRGLDQVFLDLTKRMLERRAGGGSGGGGGGGGSGLSSGAGSGVDAASGRTGRNRLLIVEDSSAQPKSRGGGCC